METSKEKLKREIAEAKKRLEQLEKEEKSESKNMAIKKLAEFSDEEKIKFFDKMYNSAISEVNAVIECGYHDEDCAQYGWESYIEILAKDKDLFWKYFNSLI